MVNKTDPIDSPLPHTHTCATSTSIRHTPIDGMEIRSSLLFSNTEDEIESMSSIQKTHKISQPLFESHFEVVPDDCFPLEDKDFESLRADLAGLLSHSKPCQNSFTSSIDSVEKEAALKESLEDFNFQPITRVFCQPQLIPNYEKTLLKQGNQQSCSVSCACMIVHDTTLHLHEDLRKLIDEFEPYFEEDLREMQAILKTAKIDCAEENMESLPLDLSTPCIVRGRFAVPKKEEMDHWVIIDKIPNDPAGNCTIRDPYSGKAAYVPFEEINGALKRGYAKKSPNILKVLEPPA